MYGEFNRCTVSKESLVVEGLLEPDGVREDCGVDRVVKYRGIRLWVCDEAVLMERFVGDGFHPCYDEKPLARFRLCNPDFVVKCSRYLGEWLARGGL